VPAGIPAAPGVVVVEASGVPVDETSVARDKPGLVGGRVDVTKAGGAEIVSSCETLRHEARLSVVRRINIQIFFIAGLILLGKY
jgi:hypothetical protein